VKYAIISDVHGNLNALFAVISDAESLNVDKYIFVGDYCSYFPNPNEATEIIKNLENKIIIKGNEDGCLAKYGKEDQSTWTDGQFQAHYWLYRTISSINRNYLLSLPKTISFKDNDKKITVTHKSSDAYGDIEYKEFSTWRAAEKYQTDSTYSRIKLLNDIHKYLSHDDFISVIQSLPDNIYIFGHTHLQWHAQVGDKLFINPGSCGLALDGTSGAPYTLLTVESNKINVTERRVPYDIDDLIFRFKNSSLYEAAPVWSSVILQELTFRFARAMFFIQFVNEYANKINDPIRPFSVKTWTEAYNIWCTK